MNTSPTCWIGFDLGGTKMRAIVYSPEFEILSLTSTRTKGFKGARDGLARVIEVIEEVLAEARKSCPGLTPAGIGIACPGPVSPATGMIYELPNLGWRKLPIGPRLEKHFGCPVSLVNDVDAGTYGEYRFGAARGARCVVGVFPGTGVGGGCVLDGRLIEGGEVTCFEIGHIPMLPDGPLCGCGQRGCLETLCSRLAIAQAAAAAAFRGEAPHLLAECGADLQQIRSRAISRAIEAGDSAVERIVRDSAHWLGMGVAGVVNLLAPDVIVLGGGLVEAMPNLYLETVRTAARRRVMRSFRKRFRVEVAALADDAGVLGAAAWAQQRLAGGAAV